MPSNLSDTEIRALVQDTVARFLGSGAARAPASEAIASHASHGRFVIVSGGERDGACLIEPAVRCTHCGYCQSYGH